jgi:hypothetical protein
MDGGLMKKEINFGLVEIHGDQLGDLMEISKLLKELII